MGLFNQSLQRGRMKNEKKKILSTKNSTIIINRWASEFIGD
jgi:hypothetical protein